MMKDEDSVLRPLSSRTHIDCPEDGVLGPPIDFPDLAIVDNPKLDFKRRSPRLPLSMMYYLWSIVRNGRPRIAE